MSLKSASEFKLRIYWATVHFIFIAELISKGLFGVLNFSIKRTEKTDRRNYLVTTTYDTSGLMVFVRFFGRIEDNKKTF